MFYNSQNFKQTRSRRIITAALCISLASQVNFQLFSHGFIISLAPLIMSVFLYFNTDLHPIKLMLSISIASPFFRGLLLAISNENNQNAILTFILADIAFYFVYSILYYFLYWQSESTTNSFFLLTIIICDYFSNIVETGILEGFTNYSYRLFQILFLIALIRSLLGSITSFLYHYFNLMLSKDSHERRYYHFVWIAASVKNELYFMQKNIDAMEKIMKKAYLLNKNLQGKIENGNKHSTTALQIALDIHDIKKDSHNIVQILTNYFNDSEGTKPMKFSEILRIVTRYSQEKIHERHSNILISTHNHVEMLVPKYFYLVSVLSSLIFNSIDAVKNIPEANITILCQEESKEIIINIIDNGSGVDDEIKELIFHPGFTTKYNKKTGDTYRGLGLSRVQAIIKEQFGGDIEIQSTFKQETNFKVILNKQLLSE